MTIAERMEGFSLIEALVAMMILAIGLMGVVKLQSVIMGASAVSQQRNEATHIAQDKIEHFRGYTALATTTGQFAYDDIASSTSADSISGVNATYSRTWSVCCADTAATACPPSPCFTDHLWKEVTVTVDWTDKDGKAQSVTLETKIAKLDPANDVALMMNAGGGGSASSSSPSEETGSSSSTTPDEGSTTSDETSTSDPPDASDTSEEGSTTPPDSTDTGGDGTTYECECHYQNDTTRFNTVKGGGCCTLVFCNRTFPGDYDNNSDHETHCTE